MIGTWTWARTPGGSGAMPPVEAAPVAREALALGAPADIAAYDWVRVGAGSLGLRVPLRDGGQIIFHRAYVLPDGRAFDWEESVRIAVLFEAKGVPA